MLYSEPSFNDLSTYIALTFGCALMSPIQHLMLEAPNGINAKYFQDLIRH